MRTFEVELVSTKTINSNRVKAHERYCSTFTLSAFTLSDPVDLEDNTAATEPYCFRGAMYPDRVTMLSIARWTERGTAAARQSVVHLLAAIPVEKKQKKRGRILSPVSSVLAHEDERFLRERENRSGRDLDKLIPDRGARLDRFTISQVVGEHQR